MYMYHVQYKSESGKKFIQRSGLNKKEILNLFLPEFNYNTMRLLYNLEKELNCKKKISSNKYKNKFQIISYKT